MYFKEKLKDNPFSPKKYNRLQFYPGNALGVARLTAASPGQGHCTMLPNNCEYLRFNCASRTFAAMTHREATTFLDTAALRTLITGTPTPAGRATAGTPHWADLGCGTGVFTLALAELLAPHSTIAAIDLQPGIKQQTTKNNVTILPQAADITQPNPTLQNLDGILIANAIHMSATNPHS